MTGTKTRKLIELKDSNKRLYNSTDKAWYVPYRLVSREADNYKTYIDPIGCQNILGRTFKNIGVDTSHNQVETAGSVKDIYNTIDDRVGVTLDILIRFGEDDYLTNEKGNRITKGLKGEEIRSSAHAYELGYIKGVSIDFHPIETFLTETNRKGWRTYSANRVAVLTKLTADVPGQGMSGELEGATYRKLTNNNQNNNMSIIDNNTTTTETVESNTRCLCNSQIGAFGRSNLDNSYIELLNIEGEGESKIFTLRNVLTGDEFTTSYDDHYDEITEDEVNNRLAELLNSNQESRSFDEVTYNELRACSACQAKMAERKKKWAEQMAKTRELEEVVPPAETETTDEVIVTEITDVVEDEEVRAIAVDANGVLVDSNNPVDSADNEIDYSSEIEQLKTNIDDLLIQVQSQQSMIEQLTSNVEVLTSTVDELKTTMSTRTIEEEEINKIQESMRKFVSESIENQEKNNQVQKQKKSSDDLNAKLEQFYNSKR